jgi:hypothetical protein
MTEQTTARTRIDLVTGATFGIGRAVDKACRVSREIADT